MVGLRRTCPSPRSAPTPTPSPPPRSNPTGTLAVTASWDETARTWDLDEALELAVPADEARFGFTGASFSPDDSTVLASPKDGTVRLWHADTGEEVLAGYCCAVVEETWPAPCPAPSSSSRPAP